MHLYLTKRSHLNSSYVNNDGQVLYKVETPYRLVGRASAIKCALPGDIDAPLAGSNRINETSPYDQTNDIDVEGDVEYDVVPNDDDENDIEHEANGN